VFDFSCLLSFNIIALCSTLLRCSVFLCFVLLLFFLFDSIKMWNVWKNVKCDLWHRYQQELITIMWRRVNTSLDLLRCHVRAIIADNILLIVLHCIVFSLYRWWHCWQNATINIVNKLIKIIGQIIQPASRAIVYGFQRLNGRRAWPKDHIDMVGNP